MNHTMLFAVALLTATVAHGADDLVFADFEGSNYGNWRSEGEAFGSAPATGAMAGQKAVTGFLGHGLVNSMRGGDKVTGRLTSPEFKIERRYITFLIGGGGWAGKTCLNLRVDGRVVRDAQGPNTSPGGSEALSLEAWDIGDLQGRTARLEIVDQAQGGWGHVNVDQIVFTDQKPVVQARPAVAIAAVPTVVKRATKLPPQERLLYNGIELPEEWPPRITDSRSRTPRRVPYLDHPPAVIPIDVGRQLFVDDFLIEETDLKRTFHYPEKYAKNPVLAPTTSLEMTGGRSVATVFNDGVWFDPHTRTFKMWYHAGWFEGTALATSDDGLSWRRPELDVVPGTNRLLPATGHGRRDGSTIWLDTLATDPAQRWKMFLYERPEQAYGGQVFTSPDGIHWSKPTRVSPVGDNTTIFFNPFRKKWVYSYRSWEGQRARGYRECDDLLSGAQFNGEDVPWNLADDLDLPDPAIVALMPKADEISREAAAKGVSHDELLRKYRSDYGDPTQLYNLDAAPYESLLLGVFAILRGPANKVCEARKIPKIIDLELAYSRDGFHWHRPDRTPFLASTRREGDWDRAYLHIAATVCNIVGDRLYFYYGGWSGLKPDGSGDMYSGGANGLAFLRRDGFASLDAGDKSGTLTTRPVTFHGRQLFVNLAAPRGELRVEVLNERGDTISPFSAEKSDLVQVDSTRQRVSWKGADELTPLVGKKVRFRFHLRQGQLYAFWVSPDARGASLGYMSGGGPEFDDTADTIGSGVRP